MGVISNSQFLPIADRVAKQAQILEDAVLLATSGIGYYIKVHGPLDFEGDFEVENDLILAANETDINLVFDGAAASYLSNIVTSLNSHVQFRADSVASLNDYLNVSGINVHELYAVTHNAVLGQLLDAVNVFRDDEIEMAKVAITSSGVGTFTDCDLLGTGTGLFSRDTGDPDVTPNSGAQQLQVLVASGIDVTNDLIINAIGVGENDGDGNPTAVSAQVTVPSSSPVGTKFNLGTDYFLDVTTVQFAGGNSGDVVTVRSRVERNIGL